ncbi:MAG: hypothetical protein ACHP7P_13715 [Terriglobales bacterium]
MASDSRLRFGCAWDCGPKVLLMPRSDVAICFAGDTFYAYPLMLQLSSAIAHYGKSRSRALDVFDLKGHTLRVFNKMRSLISDLPSGRESPDPPDTRFILGGYSWKKKKFAIWVLHFNAYSKAFVFHPVTPWRASGRKQVAIEGDHVPEAKKLLIEKLRAAGKISSGGFDMEPFEVLRDMIRSGDYPSIGGPPQLVKIYEHMNVVPYGVYWPNRESGEVTMLGRPLLAYETPERRILDPDTLKTYIRLSKATLSKTEGLQ